MSILSDAAGAKEDKQKGKTPKEILPAGICLGIYLRDI